MNTNQHPTNAQRFLAISHSVALIAFFVLGFGLHAWAIAWVAFMLPGMAHKWVNAGDAGCGRRQRRDVVPASRKTYQAGYGVTQTQAPAPYPYIDKD